MAATIEAEKTTGQLQDWASLNDTASAAPYLETSQLDLSSQVGCILHIDMAQDNTVAIANSAFFKVWGKAGSADEDWEEIIKLNYGTVSSTEIDVSSGADSGDVSMGCDTTNFHDSGVMVGSKIFVSEKGTPANSFIATVMDYSSDQCLDFMDGAANDITDTAHADKMYCITVSPYSAVCQWPVRVADEYWATKVSFHNPDDDANYLCRVRYSLITDYTSQ